MSRILSDVTNVIRMELRFIERQTTQAEIYTRTRISGTLFAVCAPFVVRHILSSFPSFPASHLTARSALEDFRTIIPPT